MMMSTLQRISAILKRMSELTQRGNSANVSASLERAAALIEHDMQEGISTIIRMYGGMGSLNDVILYEGNQPLIDGNKEFDALRSELFDKCLGLRN